MEEKEKIILKDGTVFFDIESGASENLVQIFIQSIYNFPEIFEKFTEENLESYQIKNADGLTCAKPENKYLSRAEVARKDDGIIVSLHLSDVDMVQKRLDALETKTEVQDGAISDLGEAVSGLAEERGLA